MTSDLLWKKTEVDSLTADKAGLAAEIDGLKRRLGDAEDRMGQEVGGAQRELSSLKDFLASAQEENKVGTYRIPHTPDGGCPR